MWPLCSVQAGRLLGTGSFPATTRGYAQLATWAESFGAVDKVGMEGTGHVGAGLLRFLADYGLDVWRWTGRTAPPAAGTANPTRWMPNPLPAPCNPGGLLAPRNPAMPRWR